MSVHKEKIDKNVVMLYRAPIKIDVGQNKNILNHSIIIHEETLPPEWNVWVDLPLRLRVKFEWIGWQNIVAADFAT